MIIALLNIFLITPLLWSACLFLFRPHPADLKAQIPGYWENFKKIQATYWLGIFLILMFFVFSVGILNVAFRIKLDYVKLGINNIELFTPWWFVQTVTHNFVHANHTHLVGNLVFLGMLSLYERRVKARRFLVIFLLGGIFSSTSIFFMSGPFVSVGASAGLFALGSGYFLDTPNLTRKAYFSRLATLIVLFSLLHYPPVANQLTQTLNIKIDFLGHLFGLVFGIIFCKIFPRKPSITPEVI